MVFPIKVCVICSEEFELKPDKPGFANRCPECTDKDSDDSLSKRPMGTDTLKGDAQANAERRKAIRDLLYYKDS